MKYYIGNIVVSPYLEHHGILGMEWGKRNGPPYPLDTEDHSKAEKKAGYKKSLGGGRNEELYDKNVSINKDNTKTGNGYYKESRAKPITNKDGSKTYPKGFIFNRVGQASLDINKAGVLYTSDNYEDTSRYIKTLGPTLIGNLLKTSHTTVQHIKAKSSMKVPSEEQLSKATLDFVKQDKDFFDTLDQSVYAYAYTQDDHISPSEVDRLLKDPSSKDALRFMYTVNTMIADSSYSPEVTRYIGYLKSRGFDAIPDVHDSYTATSKNPMIILNTDKVEMDSTTLITKDIFRSAKQYTKKLEKLNVSDIIDE